MVWFGMPVCSGSAGGTKTLLDLRTEALVDLTRVYVRLDRPDDGLAYFQRNTEGPERRKLVTRLANALADAGELQGALKVYKAALQAEPLAAEAATWQQAVVRAYDGLHDRERVRAEAQRLAEMVHPGTRWWTANAGSPQALRAGFDAAEEALRTLVTAYHQEAQRTGSPRTYRLAADVYRAYLSAFARDADPEWTSDYAFNISFYAAEVAWGLGDWRAAAEQYERVVDFRIPARPTAREVGDERYRATAAYNAVLAWDRLVDAEHGRVQAAPTRVDEKQGKGGLRTRAPTAGTTASALSEAEQRLVAACDRYAERFPEAKDALDIRYQAAVVFFERGQTPAALDRFGKLIALAPDSERARQAADLTLHVLETKGDWLALNARAQEYARNGALARPGTDFAKRVTKVAEASRYAWVSEVVHKQQHQDVRAAEEFLRFADDYPRSEHAPQALTYAMALLEEQGQLQRAVEVGHRALAHYPATPLRLKLAHGLASARRPRRARPSSPRTIAPGRGRTVLASSGHCSTRPPTGWPRRRARRGCTGPRWGGPSAPSTPTRRTSSASRTGRTPRTWRCRSAGCRSPRDGCRRRRRRTRRRRRSSRPGRRHGASRRWGCSCRPGARRDRLRG